MIERIKWLTLSLLAKEPHLTSHRRFFAWQLFASSISTNVKRPKSGHAEQPNHPVRPTAYSCRNVRRRDGACVVSSIDFVWYIPIFQSFQQCFDHARPGRNGGRNFWNWAGKSCWRSIESPRSACRRSRPSLTIIGRRWQISSTSSAAAAHQQWTMAPMAFLLTERLSAIFQLPISGILNTCLSWLTTGNTSCVPPIPSALVLHGIFLVTWRSMMVAVDPGWISDRVDHSFGGVPLNPSPFSLLFFLERQESCKMRLDTGSWSLFN